MHIDQLIDSKLLEQEIESGFVKRGSSPGGSFFIYCYTQKAQYEQRWNEATMQCRGLVTDAKGKIVARPFDKFFNHGQPQAPEIGLDEEVMAYDKMDGSLVFYVPGWGMATKSSFISPQAQKAQQILEEKYPEFLEGHFQAYTEAFTYMFELIAPESRVVVDYGPQEDLYLLGTREIWSGSLLTPGPSPVDLSRIWPGPTVEALAFHEPFKEVLEMPPRENAEGMVIYASGGRMQKLKQDDYLALHRVVTGVSAITVWESLAVDHVVRTARLIANHRIGPLLGLGPERVEQALSTPPEALYEQLPDEWHDWLEQLENSLVGSYLSYERLIHDYALEAEEQGFTEKKELVQWLQQELEEEDFPWQWILRALSGDFTALGYEEWDDRLVGSIWKHIRPKGATWSSKAAELQEAS